MATSIFDRIFGNVCIDFLTLAFATLMMSFIIPCIILIVLGALLLDAIPIVHSMFYREKRVSRRKWQKENDMLSAKENIYRQGRLIVGLLKDIQLVF